MEENRPTMDDIPSGMKEAGRIGTALVQLVRAGDMTKARELLGTLKPEEWLPVILALAGICSASFGVIDEIAFRYNLPGRSEDILKNVMSGFG